MARRYVPDLPSYDNMDVTDPRALTQQFRTLRRNLELISAALNGIDAGLATQITNIVAGGSSGSLEEKNYFVRIWQVVGSEDIPEEEIIATTGVKVLGDGGLKITGELKII